MEVLLPPSGGLGLGGMSNHPLSIPAAFTIYDLWQYQEASPIQPIYIACWPSMLNLIMLRRFPSRSFSDVVMINDSHTLLCWAWLSVSFCCSVFLGVHFLFLPYTYCSKSSHISSSVMHQCGFYAFFLHITRNGKGLDIYINRNRCMSTVYSM